MLDSATQKNVIRLALALLTLALVAVAAVTFYTMASLPTDENVFTTAPSTVYVSHAVPARAEGAGRARSGGRSDNSLTSMPDSLCKGDLLIAVGGQQVRTHKSLQTVLAQQPDDSVRVRIYRPVRDAYYNYAIAHGTFTADLFEIVDSAVVVVDVLSGGASDRAGMKIGDVIVRINNKTFHDAQEADAILRRGESGAATVYDIVRNGQPKLLTVTLARFGFPLGLLVLWLTGLCYMGFGALLVFRRPELIAARTIGCAFLLMGFAITVMWIRGEPDPTWFTRGREVLTVLAAFLGTASSFHAQGVFPVERSKPAHRRWVTPAMYVLGFLSPLLLLTGFPAITWVVLVNFILAGGIASIFGLTKLSPPQKRIVRPIQIVVSVVITLSILTAVGLGVLGRGGLAGFVGILLLLIPLTYAYVIGHYRLMGMDFRVRRNVQYTFVSWIWGILVAVLFLRLLLTIPEIPLHVPSIIVSGFSVEINPMASSPDQKQFLERLVMMLVGVVIWYVLWRLRKAGQHLIDRKYYRTQFDYRRAAESLSEVLSTRLTMNDIARGIVDTLSDILNLKRTGLLIFRNGEECCCEAVAGMSQEDWHQIACVGDREFAQALGSSIEPVRTELLRPDIRTLLISHEYQFVVPIRSKDKLAGALLVGEKLSETPLGAEDQSFLADVARQMSVAIENAFLYEELAEKERMRHELNIARRIQMSSLPSTTPQIPGLDIAGISSPALEVGGDFFDYLDGTGDSLTIVVGDVSGKGTSAALYMAKVQGILRSLHGFGLHPRELFVRANRLLCKDLEKSSFVTALGGHFTPADRRVTLVRAGHVPLFHFHARSASVERVLPRGLGLGLNDAGVFAQEIEERVVDYAPGDIMVFVTDGVLEARNANGEEFGEQRVSTLLSQSSGLDATGLRDNIVQAIERFGDGTDQHDDMTLVVVRAV